MIENKTKFIFLKKLSISFLIVFFIVVFFAGLLLIGFEFYYQDKIYPGVRIDNIDLSGLTKEQAKQFLEEKVNIFTQNGVNFNYENKIVNITPVISSFSGGLAYRVLSFDIDKTIKNAFDVGRDDDFSQNLRNIFYIYKNKKNIKVKFKINLNEIEKILEDSYKEYETPVQNASIVVTTTPLNKVVVDIKKEKTGVVIDYKDGLNQLTNNLQKLDGREIKLFAHKQNPSIYKKDCLDKKEQVDIILSHAPIILTAKSEFLPNGKWTIDKSQLASWLKFGEKNNDILVDFNDKKIKQFLEKNVKNKTDVSPINAKFQVKNNKVEKFQTGKNGVKLNINDSIKEIKFDVLTEGKRNVKLVLDTVKIPIEDNKAEELGIKEIIGEGHSNFRGSSWKRKHNIKIGADTINGLLISPNEEFSLVGALGEISSSTGYLPELVIKGNETIPEYGGGLCQVGTTLFRTVLDAGLKVTARRNHSYRVSYYEPAGTDATIYDPQPDFKFINDTQNYILIQYKMEGNNLSFTFWGTKDGRKATTTYPVIYKVTKPGPTKIIKTTKLKPGEKKCTEHAHNGADAYFDYTVKYSDGTERKRTFYSHYIPWREVCLLGVDKNASSTDDDLNK